MPVPIIVCLRRSLIVAFVSLALVLAVGVPPAVADLNLDGCRAAAKAQNQVSRLVCNVPFVPSEEERKAITQETMNMVLDLKCSLSVDVSKDELTAMATTSSWQAPAQSATCDIVTSEGS